MASVRSKQLTRRESFVWTDLRGGQVALLPSPGSGSVPGGNGRSQSITKHKPQGEYAYQCRECRSTHGISACRANRADGNEDSHGNDNDSPCHRRMSRVCVGCLNCTASNTFHCIYVKCGRPYWRGASTNCHDVGREKAVSKIRQHPKRANGR